ncbi:hypothetical protein FISHEDRAFT_59973 [Fistulina hepatica ATCC 64428]|uniref:Uncharacterized protein n=1 Tax=Fistulina hepatica ATCC 64428 TaxID=1128425 RepID=A0A0D7AAJ2_9AGAR|nr:hypothetical protein FISHEDRAFT_59973 [Fistulina hepatica ATCC 64428]
MVVPTRSAYRFMTGYSYQQHGSGVVLPAHIHITSAPPGIVDDLTEKEWVRTMPVPLAATAFFDLEANIHDWDAFEEWLEAPDRHAMLTREQIREKHPGLVGDWTDKEVEVMPRIGLLKSCDKLPAVDPRFLPDNVTPESTALCIYQPTYRRTAYHLI